MKCYNCHKIIGEGSSKGLPVFCSIECSAEFPTPDNPNYSQKIREAERGGEVR